MKFDWFGFGVFAMGIAGLAVDAGPRRDAGLVRLDRDHHRGGDGGPRFYLFIVHMLTAEKPFITPAVFKDRNLSAGLLVMFAVGMVLLAVSALLAPWLQDLADYPVETAGIAMAPRGLGTMAAMLIAGRLSNKVDAAPADGVRHRGAELEPVPDDRLDPGGFGV